MRQLPTVIFVALVLSACATDPNEGVFVINGVVKPRLTDSRLAEIRRAWTPASQPRSEATKAGRYASYWILDLIAHTELTDDATCPKLDLLAIQTREIDLVIRRPRLAGETTFGSVGETQLLRAATYHEAWIVSACGKRLEWRVLDDTANPQNPLRVFRWSAA
jgi:hypothetical protein